MLRRLKNLLSKQAGPSPPVLIAAAAQGPLNQFDDLLFDLAEKAYERETEENDGMWRTLPVFAASFGFAVALLGYSYANAPPPARELVPIAVYGLVAIATASFVWSFRWFWLVVRPQQFRYLPPAVEIFSYGDQLRSYHREAGATLEEAGRRATIELKAYVALQWAQAAGHNRKLNQLRSDSRGRTVFYLMVAFAVALLANAIILSLKTLEAAAAVEVQDAYKPSAPPARQTPAAAAAGAPASELP
jgi:hypothetical protein